MDKGLLADYLSQVGIGLLQSSGPSLQPRSLGQGLAAGMQRAGQFEQQMAERKRQELADKFRQAQLDELVRKSAEAKRVAAQQEASRGLLRGLVGTPENAPEDGMGPVMPGTGILGAAGDNPQAQFAASLLAVPGMEDKALSLLSEQMKPQKPAELVKAVGPDGQLQWVPKSQASGMGAAPSGVTINTGDQGVGASTYVAGGANGGPIGDKMPKGTVYQVGEKGKVTKLFEPPKQGAEEAKAFSKYFAVLDMADEFNAIADDPKNVGTDTGKVMGHWARAQSLWGGQSEVEAELMSMEKSMETQLGTALSGAAIPESEWPRYIAQLPRMTDAKHERKAKVKVLGKMLSSLEQQSKRVRSGGKHKKPNDGWSVEEVTGGGS